MLSENDFKSVVMHSPLFAIDLVVLNPQRQLLVGLRKNAPAKNFWFVPGGRVFKGESQSEAFFRITKNELGISFPIEHAALLGVFDHFYDDSIFGSDISTHYINTPYLINLGTDALALPTEQHSNYRWVNLSEFIDDLTVNPFSKVFLDSLNTQLNIESTK